MVEGRPWWRRLARRNKTLSRNGGKTFSLFGMLKGTYKGAKARRIETILGTHLLNTLKGKENLVVEILLFVMDSATVVGPTWTNARPRRHHHPTKLA
jgi:hypothetical protein